MLGVIRDDWEEPDDIAGPARIGTCESALVCSDAALYDRKALSGHLSVSGWPPRSKSPSDLIAASYRAWGGNCPNHLFGDFAFVAWDPEKRTLLAARDPFGSRSLFFRQVDGGLLLASTPHPLVSLFERPPSFNPVATLRSLLFHGGVGQASAWEGIEELPPGHHLDAWVHEDNAEGVSFRISESWKPGSDPAAQVSWGREAPEALAAILSKSVRGRVPESGAGLAISGGYDSTALLGALYRGTETFPEDIPFHLLSYRLPPEEHANEDRYLSIAAESFGLPINWVDTDGIRLLNRDPSQVAERAYPEGHLHESLNRALGRTARDLGVRVLLSGNGGDNLFFVPPYFLADLFRSGRWLQLFRLLPEGRRPKLGHIKRWVIKPSIPYPMFDLLELVLRRPIDSRPFEWPVPPWLNGEVLEVSKIREGNRTAYAKRVLARHRSVDSRFRVWAASDSRFSRVCATLFAVLRSEGVELRSPFYDRRVLSFALSRPFEEMHRPGELKPLLRDSMRGRLPEEILAPRLGGRGKTGTFEHYFHRRLESEIQEKISRLRTPWESVRMGLVSPDRFRRSVDRALEGRLEWDAFIVAMVAVEEWLQAHAPPRS